MTTLATPAARGGHARFLAAVAAAPGILLVAQLLPVSGPGLALRLAGAAACVLVVPGALLLRATVWPASPAIAVAASFALSLAVLAFALGVVFLVGGSIMLAALVVAAVSALALVAGFRRSSQPGWRGQRRAALVVLSLAVAYAGVVWWAAGPLQSDGFFHAARARKLAEFHSLDTLASVGEFKNGSLHPGYAFPLWHAAEALVARLGGVDVVDVMVYLPAILVPLAFLLVYALGAAVFDSPVGGLALVAAQVAQFGFVRGGANPAGTGLFENLTWARESVVLLLVPATLALTFAFVAEGERMVLVSLGAAAVGLTAVHPTYDPYAGLVVAGFLIGRLALTRRWEPALSRAAIALGTVLAPFVLYVVALYPSVRNTIGFNPSAGSRAEDIRHYGTAAFTLFHGWFGMAPGAIARGGPLIVAGLLAIPLAGFAARRRWAALVLGASLVILTLLLVPPLFTAVSDALTLSQSRRLPQFLPLGVAVVGGCVVLSRLRALGVGIAAAAGVAFVFLYFSYDPQPLGPGWTVWVAVAGGLAALVASGVARRRGPSPGLYSAATALALVLPMAVAGLAGVEQGRSDGTLTSGVVEAVRSDVPAGDVVFSDRKTAYVLAAYAPVYINATTPTHGTDTRKNQLAARSRDARRFFAGRSLSDATRRHILERWGADWVLVNKEEPHPDELPRDLRLVYQDGRFALYRVGS